MIKREDKIKQEQIEVFPEEISKIRHAEGRTRTGTLDNQRGILSPLRPLRLILPKIPHGQNN